MAPNEWLRRGAYATIAGHRVFYREAGAGEPVLLIHGFPTASWDWHKVWPPLAQRHRLVAMDLLGFGFSDKPTAHHYTIGGQADLCEALAQHLGVGQAHILAHDYGDTVAQELLARQADGKLGFAITSACLLNGGLFPETHRPRITQYLLQSAAGPLLSRLFGKATLSKNFKKIFGPDSQPTLQEIDGFYQLIQYNNGNRLLYKLVHYMAERQKHRARWVGALTEPPCPIRLVVGYQDPISGRHMADRYRTLVPNPDIIGLERIGHYTQTEAPEAVSKHFLEFAAQHAMA